jgi:uncharacterized protein YdeI (YjbR/CyaY-like superfamily)
LAAPEFTSAARPFILSIIPAMPAPNRPAKSASRPAATSDPRVTAYIDNAQPFAVPILDHLRKLIHRAVPTAAETVKWRMPFFTTANGTNLCHMCAFKNHAAFGIWNTRAQAALKKAGYTDKDAMGALGRITSLKDLPPDKVLIAQLRTAAKDAAAGISYIAQSRARAEKRPEPKPHADFTAALAKNKAAAKTLTAFAPSHRREYIRWINDAKRDSTRNERIARAIIWLAEGKPLNWKYLERTRAAATPARNLNSLL